MVSAKKIVINPVMLSFVIGVILFFPACKASCFRIRHTGKHIADERAYRYAHRGVLSCTGITEEAFFGRPQLCGLRCKIACYPSAYRGIACSPALR